MTSYYQIGAENPANPSTGTNKSNPVITVGILALICGAIYGLSPGALHFYKHGKLPR